MHKSDWQLLREYVDEGSEAAFAVLVSRHRALVYQACRREARDAQLAEDAAQVVFLLLARKAPALARGVSIPGWLAVASRLTARNMSRRESAWRRRLEEMDRHGPATPERALADEALHDALGGLSEADRHAVLMRYVDGLSLEEIGEAIGTSGDTARKRVTRALEKLRRVMGSGELAAPLAIAGQISGSRIAALLRQGAQITMKAFKRSPLYPAAAAVAVGLALAFPFAMLRADKPIPPPTPGVAKQSPAAQQALNNAKQIAIACMEYSQDYNVRFPLMQTDAQFQNALRPYVLGNRFSKQTMADFIDPESGKPFLINHSLSRRPLAALQEPQSVVLVYAPQPDSQGLRVVAFADGHVKFLTESGWEQVKITLTDPTVRVTTAPKTKASSP